MDDINRYYPPWLTNQECGENYKRNLVRIYDEYYVITDKKQKQEKMKELQVYLTIVCDIVAYRYLLKHHANLFRRLHITVEEYMTYKVDRMIATIKDKKGKIKDILAYIYMSFMLSSPRLIYDYAESIGRCKLVKENMPYFQTQRLKFFFIERETSKEHIIFDFSAVDIDSIERSIRSDIERYSLEQYNNNLAISSSDSSYNVLREFINSYDATYIKSKKYLLHIFDSWKENVESDFEYIRQVTELKDNYNLLDYIRYKYENKQIDLNYNEYVEVLSILNSILKERKTK